MHFTPKKSNSCKCWIDVQAGPGLWSWGGQVKSWLKVGQCEVFWWLSWPSGLGVDNRTLWTNQISFLEFIKLAVRKKQQSLLKLENVCWELLEAQGSNLLGKAPVKD